MCRYILPLLICWLPIFTFAQQGGGFGIEVNAMAGKILKHTPKFKPPIPDHSTAFEINFIRQTDGRKPWQQRRNYPVVGWGIALTDYGIDSIYGKSISIYPN